MFFGQLGGSCAVNLPNNKPQDFACSSDGIAKIFNMQSKNVINLNGYAFTCLSESAYKQLKEDNKQRKAQSAVGYWKSNCVEETKSDSFKSFKTYYDITIVDQSLNLVAKKDGFSDDNCKEYFGSGSDDKPQIITIDDWAGANNISLLGDNILRWDDVSYSRITKSDYDKLK